MELTRKTNTISILTMIVCFLLGMLASIMIDLLLTRTEQRQPIQATYIYKTIIMREAPNHMKCVITAYTNHPNETNKDNTNTAIMDKPTAGWTCAVSQDLITWLGGTIYIKGIGIRKVNDLMNKKYKKRLDLCVGSKKEARKFGIKTMTVIYLGKK